MDSTSPRMVRFKYYFLSIYTLVLFLFLLVGFLAGMYYGDMLGLRGPVATPTPTPQRDDQVQVTPEQSGVPDGGIACTADAMQCADGTWVGRSGPNCEFVCPGANASVTPYTTLHGNPPQ